MTDKEFNSLGEAFLTSLSQEKLTETFVFVVSKHYGSFCGYMMLSEKDDPHKLSKTTHLLTSGYALLKNGRKLVLDPPELLWVLTSEVHSVTPVSELSEGRLKLYTALPYIKFTDVQLVCVCADHVDGMFNGLKSGIYYVPAS